MLLNVGLIQKHHIKLNIIHTYKAGQGCLTAQLSILIHQYPKAPNVGHVGENGIISEHIPNKYICNVWSQLNENSFRWWQETSDFTHFSLSGGQRMATSLKSNHFWIVTRWIHIQSLKQLHYFFVSWIPETLDQQLASATCLRSLILEMIKVTHYLFSGNIPPHMIAHNLLCHIIIWIDGFMACSMTLVANKVIKAKSDSHAIYLNTEKPTYHNEILVCA